MKLTIIGSGRAAWTFASLWMGADRLVDAVVSRNELVPAWISKLGIEHRPLLPASFEQSEVVLFAVSDQSIATVYRSVRHAIQRDAVVWHASGALTSSLFAHERRFSLHPLRSLPRPGSPPPDLTGTLFTWEGEPSTRELAEQIVRDASGQFRAIETAAKPLYHAAAVFGSNFVAAMLEQSVAVIESAGVEGARDALATLASSAVENWRQGSGPDRFTGPIARGEAEIVQHHIAALRPDPERAEIYSMMARVLTGILAGELEEAELRRIEDAINDRRQS